MTVHCIAIEKRRWESSWRTGFWIKMRCVSVSSPPWGNCVRHEGLPCPNGRGRAGTGGLVPAVRDGWRNCPLGCLTCTAGWGLLLTGVPGRSGIRNEEAGKPEGPLERRDGSRLSSSHCIWRQMFPISPAPKGRKWWAQLEELGYSWQTAPVVFWGFFHFLED